MVTTDMNQTTPISELPHFKRMREHRTAILNTRTRTVGLDFVWAAMNPPPPSDYYAIWFIAQQLKHEQFALPVLFEDTPATEADHSEPTRTILGGANRLHAANLIGLREFSMRRISPPGAGETGDLRSFELGVLAPDLSLPSVARRVIAFVADSAGLGYPAAHAAIIARAYDDDQDDSPLGRIITESLDVIGMTPWDFAARFRKLYLGAVGTPESDFPLVSDTPRTAMATRISWIGLIDDAFSGRQPTLKPMLRGENDGMILVLPLNSQAQFAAIFELLGVHGEWDEADWALPFL